MSNKKSEKKKKKNKRKEKEKKKVKKLTKLSNGGSDPSDPFSYMSEPETRGDTLRKTYQKNRKKIISMVLKKKRTDRINSMKKFTGRQRCYKYDNNEEECKKLEKSCIWDNQNNFCNPKKLNRKFDNKGNFKYDKNGFPI